MYISHCKHLRKLKLKFLENFVLKVKALSAADLLEIKPHSAAFFYWKLRAVIVYYLAQKAHEIFGDAIQLDEIYFGGVCKGECGLGSAGKLAVFGILKHGSMVYTKVVMNYQGLNTDAADSQ